MRNCEFRLKSYNHRPGGGGEGQIKNAVNSKRDEGADGKDFLNQKGQTLATTRLWVKEKWDFRRKQQCFQVSVASIMKGTQTKTGNPGGRGI